MEIKCWVIEFSNYEGEDFKEYFAGREFAMQTFNKIAEKFKDFDEYYYETYSYYSKVSWFDPSYNENSTCVTAYEDTIIIHDHILDLI